MILPLASVLFLRRGRCALRDLHFQETPPSDWHVFFSAPHPFPDSPYTFPLRLCLVFFFVREACSNCHCARFGVAHWLSRPTLTLVHKSGHLSLKLAFCEVQTCIRGVRAAQLEVEHLTHLVHVVALFFSMGLAEQLVLQAGG